MKHGSLFNGIGGFQLAAAWMGWTNIFSCEIDNFCNQVTKKHFPDCIQHGDIKTTDFTIYRGRIDIVTGGFPCQPFSTAGHRKGTDDDRYLWAEMLRAIREIQPRFIVGENVYGLVNWSGGLVFNQVQTDLENEGYEVQAYILPACSKNAPQKRERIWFIANLNQRSNMRSSGKNESKGKKERLPKRDKVQQPVKSTCLQRLPTNTNKQGLPVRLQTGFKSIQEKTKTFEGSKPSRTFTEDFWTQFPTTPIFCGRVHGIPERVDRIKALGNAIVPQVAFEIFKAIEQTSSLTPP